MHIHMPKGVARGQNLVRFKIFVGCGSFKESFVFEKQVLFRVDIYPVTSDLEFQLPRVGLQDKI